MYCVLWFGKPQVTPQSVGRPQAVGPSTQLRTPVRQGCAGAVSDHNAPRRSVCDDASQAIKTPDGRQQLLSEDQVRIKIELAEQ